MTAPLYVWYGDDFTGSTDVLESLAGSGVPAMLFLRPPGAADLARYPGLKAVGLASDSRSRSPEWMSATLPGVFDGLRALGAPVTHYKTCSTFDSSPHTGSIGRALEIGREAFGNGLVPIVIGAAHLRRYLLFGTLFAAAANQVYRIDRHPTMSRHPVTPMREADMRLHLAEQTALPIALIDLPTLMADGAAALRTAGESVVMIDGVDTASMARAGQVIWDAARGRALFGVGSSGLTRGLVEAWRDAGLVERDDPQVVVAPADRILVVSGSCSPMTATQIEWSLANGFAGLPVDVPALLDGNAAYAEGLVEAAVERLAGGGNPLIYTTMGAPEGTSGGDALGTALGLLLRRIVVDSGVGRVVIAGGDTSSHAVAQLGIDALGWVGPLEPGAPLCRAFGGGPRIDGLELVLKGGQMGSPAFFDRARRGDS